MLFRLAGGRYTGGRNENTPGCGTCGCCQDLAAGLLNAYLLSQSIVFRDNLNTI